MNYKNILKNISWGQIIFTVLTLILAMGGFIFVRNIVTCWAVSPLPGRTPADCGTMTALSNPNITVDENGTPIATTNAPPTSPSVSVPESNLPPAWDGASRVTILIMGLDYRDYLANDGPPRTDSMIVLSIDPASKSAAMLSVPRDLWVNIPGFGYSRINTAYPSGEGAKLPGGGPELARKTVEQFLGVPIQYYAQIDFNAFVEFINAIGGIDINNDEELRLDPIGGGTDKIRLTCCGMRHLTGETTLAYVRFRKGEGGDVARAQRQQKVILAIRDKVLSPENFTTMLGKAQDFYNEFSAGIRTNMPFETALQLGVLAKDVPIDSIKHGVIDYTMVALDDVILDGQNANVMKPLPDKIRVLRDELFTTGGATSPLAVQGDPTALMKDDTARIRLLNASSTVGLEVNTGNYFLKLGLAVTAVGTADQQYNGTIVVVHSPKLYTLKYLMTMFNPSTTQILIRPDPTAPVDFDVYLGNDWAKNNTLQ